jgi:hypothetical protein
MFVGTRCRITREILVRVTIVTIGVMIEIIVMTVREVAAAIVVTMDHGVA